MPGGTFVYVASPDSSEILVFAMDPETAALEPLQQVKLRGSPPSLPLAVSPDRRFMYAGQRLEPFSVAALAVDGYSGELSVLGYAPLYHQSPYVQVDRTGRWLLSVSYQDAVVSVSALGTQGFPQPPHQVVRTPAHPHSIQVDGANRHALVPSLGGDVFLQWRFDAVSGLLSPNEPAFVRVQDGAGPRHFAFHPSGRHAYLLNELDASLLAFSYDPVSGLLSERQVSTALPDDFTGPPHGMEGVSTNGGPKAADVHVTPDGRFLYASERTTSTIACFRVDLDTGLVQRTGSIVSEATPRGFNVDPTGRFLLAVGQTSDHLSVYDIHRETGALTFKQRYPAGHGPHWVEILRLP